MSEDKRPDIDPVPNLGAPDPGADDLAGQASRPSRRGRVGAARSRGRSPQQPAAGPPTEAWDVEAQFHAADAGAQPPTNGAHDTANGNGAPSTGRAPKRARAATTAHTGAALATPPAPPSSRAPTGNGRGRHLPPPPPPGYRRAEPLELPEPARPRTRLKKLRLLGILLATLILGLVSFVFGMFISVSSDLPSLENRTEFSNASNSVLLDDHGKQIAILTQNDRIYLKTGQVPSLVGDAVISVEDKRFYHNSGIDLKGILRAVVEDVLHQQAVQGASTIEQQFIKNVLAAQGHRTIFEKLREAALAYHLSHEWSKEKILTEYLNTIYFGNGAYGIESAAETYFGREASYHGCGASLTDLCVTQLQYHPADAALLAGIIASPSGFDPVAHPTIARERRDVVLQDMFAQHYIDHTQYENALAAPLPDPSEVEPPELTTEGGYNTGYFDDWVEQQVLARYGSQRTFEGGLKITTSLDLGLQQAAEQAVNAYLPSPDGPDAALVAIDNATGQVKAMVGGRDYDTSPFNLATQGERQPGSAFKAFDLAVALRDGISPYSVWPSHPLVLHDPHGGIFVVRNDESAYAGTNSLIDATAFSDNTVFAQVGVKVGTHHIAAIAHRMGITTPISTNYAMTIGGLSTGVTVLDMAHAYETLAEDGRRVSGSLVAGPTLDSYAPVGIEKVRFPGGHEDVDRPEYRRVLPAWVASTETSMLETVLEFGTGTKAAIGGFEAGKTGTTSNYADAWFVGWNDKYTVAVWVGYPNKLIPMTTDFGGSPVLGGTFPALIWHTFMQSALEIADSSSSSTSASGTALGAEPVAGAGTAAGATASSSSSATPAAPASGNHGTASPTGTGGTNTNTNTNTGAGTGTGTSPTTGTGAPGASTPTTPAPAASTPTPATTPAPAASTPATGGGSATGGSAAPSGGAAAPSG